MTTENTEESDCAVDFRGPLSPSGIWLMIARGLGQQAAAAELGSSFRVSGPSAREMSTGRRAPVLFLRKHETCW